MDDLRVEVDALRAENAALANSVADIEDDLYGIGGSSGFSTVGAFGIEAELEDVAANQSSIVDYLNCLTNEFSTFCAAPFLR